MSREFKGMRQAQLRLAAMPDGNIQMDLQGNLTHAELIFAIESLKMQILNQTGSGPRIPNLEQLKKQLHPAGNS